MSGCAVLSVIPLPASNQQVGINPIAHSPMNIFKRLYITWLTQKVARWVWSNPHSYDEERGRNQIDMIEETVNIILHMYQYDKDEEGTTKG